ncbi:MAG TPA: T9SS type A sorting domain-containing protein [Ignavibacteria bacterium]|nr:T9SS type A sorting domain-containing protein [Ignavibacteria bacterium]
MKTIFTFIFIITSSVVFSQLVNDTRVNDENTGAPQYSTNISQNKSGNFVIVWEDERSAKPDVFFQMYNANGTPIGINTQINEFYDTAKFVDVAMYDDGSFVVCYQNFYRTIQSFDTKIFIKFYNSLGIPVSNEIQVNDTIGTFMGYPKIDVCHNNKNVVVVFEYAKNYHQTRSDIFYQMFDSIGNRIGNNRMANDDTLVNYRQEYSDIAVRSDGKFVITWADAKPPATLPGFDNVFMQVFDSLGNKIGINTIVNDIIYPEDYEARGKIAMNDSGHFVIAFIVGEFFPNISTCKFQVYNKNFERVGNNRYVPEFLEDIFLYAAAMDQNGEFVLGYWISSGGVRPPRFSRFNKIGDPIGQPKNISNLYPSLTKYVGSIELKNDNIINVFSDNRLYPNGDVYFNIMSFRNPDSVVSVTNISSVIPKDFDLKQNYPNPFNPETNIEFEIPKTSEVSISVYDALGREISKLLNKQLNPGKYKINWNAESLPSGVYFYNLTTNNFSQTKRMILIK